VGLKTGLRYTITEHNVEDLAGVVDLLVDVGVDRFCFYHLDYGGRGADISDVDLSPEATRKAVTDLCDLTREYHESGEEIETLLVGNYADAGHLVEYADREMGTDRAQRIYRYLERNGGDPPASASPTWTPSVTFTLRSSGRDTRPGTSETDRSARSGRTSRTRFSGRSEREDHLSGKCADCAYQSVCRGGSRLRCAGGPRRPVRADPKCYLTEAERDDGEAAMSESDSRRAGRRRGLIGIIVVAHRFTIADR